MKKKSILSRKTVSLRRNDVGGRAKGDAARFSAQGFERKGNETGRNVRGNAGRPGTSSRTAKRRKLRGVGSRMNFQLISKDGAPDTTVSALNRGRLLMGAGFLIALIMLLCLRMGYWQILKADDLQTRAASMQTQDAEIDSQRGTIYDSRMSALAETVTEYELYVYSQALYKDDKITEAQRTDVIKKLAALTGKSKDALKKKLTTDENLVLIADGLNKTKIDTAEKYWGGNIFVKTSVSRSYPNGVFASQLIGSVNDENTGRSGLEYEYNSVLSGVKGRTVRKTDRDGNTLANGGKKYYEAQDGNSIVTSVDAVIQHYVENAIQTGMARTGASGITVLVMNPKNGRVMAMAQTPEFNPNKANEPVGTAEKASFNRMSSKQQSEYLSKMWTIEAVSSIYEPGSTFKLITAASSLETGHSNDASRYYCGGGINVNGTTLKCLGSHGSQSLKVAVGYSCNAALARVALDMGAHTFYNYIDLFGFRDKTGIDLPGETYSIVKNPDTMGAVDLATTGFGQGIAITPIQILSAVNALGNGGYLYKPTVASKILDADGKVVDTIKPTKIRQVISKETADEMREIMEYYVAEAGGDKAYLPGYRIGGKTGTANIASGGGYSDSTDCSFVAMAPMDNPQISMLVIVHRPTKTQYGNDSAGPIVKEIMKKSLPYLGVEKEYTQTEASKDSNKKVTVPKVSGMNSKKAASVLKGKHLNYKTMPEGSSGKSFAVVDQYPKAGTKVARDTVVYLYSE